MRLLTHIVLPIAAICFAVDRLSKWYVVDYLDLRTQGYIEAWPPFLNLVMAWNTGINFGIPLGGRWVLVGLSIAISAALIVWVWRRGSRTMAAGAGFVVGGALGNVVDRVLYGAVADFLNMSCCGFNNPWSFNVADISIFVGAIGLILLTGGTKETSDSPQGSE